MEIVELELCANCKKEIPHTNYVMHTAHCARNITLCPICKEPVAKAQLESHKREFHVGNFGNTISSSQSAKRANQNISTSSSKVMTNGYSHNSVETSKKSTTETVAKGLEKVSLDKKVTQPFVQPLRNGKPKSDLIPCKFCELELSKGEITDHENYCGSRTDKCMECGELVMFKYKKLHEETNHGFLKLNDEPGPRPTWDSSSQRSTSSATNSRSASTASNSASPFSDGNYRPMPLRTTSLLDTTLYSFPEEYRPPVRQSKANAESYKQITRRLDCKTEYIKNLLHDSASITVPIRTNAMTPRNRFSHSKGPAPLPPTAVSYTPDRSTTSNPLSPTTPTNPTSTLFTATPAPYVPYSSSAYPASDQGFPLSPPPPTPSSRRPNPSTELLVPCDYCTLVLPHRDLVEHEEVCGRSYLSTERAQASARRRREVEEWGEEGGSGQQGVYGFDGGDDGFYSAYRTSAPNGESNAANGARRDSRENGFSSGGRGGVGMNTTALSAAKTNSTSSNSTASPSPFDFNRPSPPSNPITVSALLSPTTDYSPSRPSLVSTLGSTTTTASSSSSSSTTRYNQSSLLKSSSTPASSNPQQQSCAGAAAAAAAGGMSPEVQLPCEFCADMIPASQLLRHQATCF